MLITGVSYAAAQDTGENLDVTTHKDHNQLLAEVGNTVNEFGGFYFSKDAEGDVLNIYLTENESSTDKQNAARDAVEKQVRGQCERPA